MREDGARLTGENANFDAFAVLMHPIIDHLKSACPVGDICCLEVLSQFHEQ